MAGEPFGCRCVRGREAGRSARAAVSPELTDRGGLYLEECGVSDAVAPYARDAERAAELWRVSEKMCAAS